MLFVWDLEAIIVVTVAVILLFAVLKFIAKVMLKIIAAIIIIGFFAFVLLYWRGGIINMDSFFDMKTKYCVEEKDPIKCSCIIEPIEADIRQFYTTDADIEQLRKNKIEALSVVQKSFRRVWPDIKLCLKQNGALDNISEMNIDSTLNDFKIDDLFQLLDKQ